MARSTASIPWHEVGIRISAHGILSREAEHDHAIAPSDVRDVFIRRSLLSPLALVMPLISLVIGVGIVVLFFHPPGLPWWCLILPTLFIAYAVHTVWYFCRTRTHSVFVSAPTVAPSPILFYVTENAQEAAELISAIEAVTKRGDL